jgi:hypothetical protein
VLQTLSKFDQVRISLTTNDRISDKLPNKIRTSAVASRLNNLGCIYLLSAICSKQSARKDPSGSAQSAASNSSPSLSAPDRAGLSLHGERLSRLAMPECSAGDANSDPL